MERLALKLAADSGEDWVGVGGAAAAQGEADFCSREGALALKAKIEAYWRERGQQVMIALHNVGFHPAIRAARYDVRSDMVNGMPRPGAQAKKPVLVDDLIIEDADDGDDSFE